jgi:beta-lactam-binding protein with PASTA domain
MKPVKKFSYSITEKVTENIIGKGIGSTSTLELLPNFVGRNVSYAESYASSHGINIDINYVDGTASQFSGQILSQTVPAKTDLDMLGSYPVVLKVVRNVVTTPSTPVETNDEPESNSNSNSNNNEQPEPTDNTGE